MNHIYQIHQNESHIINKKYKNIVSQNIKYEFKTMRII